MARLSPEEIEKARAVPLDAALERLGCFVSVDRDFQPRKNAASVSVFVTDGNDTRELIMTGPKWFDKREGVGGGGAIDLAMHLKGWTLRQAVRALLKP